MQSTTCLAAQYIEMHQEKVRLEVALKAHKDQMAALEESLKEQFINEGVASIKTVNGLVYLYKQVWARCSNPAALACTRWAWLVGASVNTNSLSAAVRELELDTEGKPDLPEEVKELIDISEVWSVRVRQASGH